MNTTKEIAKHFSEVYFGGNWTSSNLKDLLSNIGWTEAKTQVYKLNTSATLTNHTHYYVLSLTEVLNGSKLRATDALGFAHKPINLQEDWDRIKSRIWKEGEKSIKLIEQLDVTQLLIWFENEKYGTYFRNLVGTIEHKYYHLGQIAILKKIIQIKSE